MISATRPCAALLLVLFANGACADDSFTATTGTTAVDQTGDDSRSFAAQYVSHGVREDQGRKNNVAAFDVRLPGGWTLGSSTARVDGRLIDKGRFATRFYGGYRGGLGPLGYSALTTWYSYPGARRGLTGTGYDFGEVSAGLSYGSLYARYNYTLSRDFFGIPDARGSGYLDLGMRHELDHRMSLMLHAGDGHVAGASKGMWDWRDLRAGLNRKFENGWMLALNYTRAFGAAGPYDRYSLPGGRADERPMFVNAGRKALVLSLRRSF
jgi:uncharacterized protein (TIGR02001 family)